MQLPVSPGKSVPRWPAVFFADQLVRAVVEIEARAPNGQTLACDIAVGDLAERGALAKAFEGTEGVFAMLPPVFDPAPGFPEAGIHRVNVTASCRSEAKKVVALSSIGADALQPNLLNALWSRGGCA